MEADDALFQSAAAAPFAATLRLYSWRPAALSIGRRQRMEDVNLAACRARGLDVVKRIGGGAAVYHGDDVTYCFVCRIDKMPAPTPQRWRGLFCDMLRGLGIKPDEKRACPAGRSDANACFARAAEDEPTVGGKKWVGSARRKNRGVFLQHGSILLRPQPAFLTGLLDNAPPDSSTGLLALAPAITETIVRDAFVRAAAENFRLDFSPA